MLRQVLSSPINAVGVFLASRWLSLFDFGIQAVILSVVGFVLFVIDLGTSSALIQRKPPPSKKLVWKIQAIKLVMLVGVTIALELLSPWLLGWFSLSSSLRLLFPVIALLAWLQSWRDLESVSLQRNIEWALIARIELAEIIAYNATLIFVAYQYHSLWSFPIAIGARWLVGSVLLKLATTEHFTDTAAAESDLVAVFRLGIPLQASLLLGSVMNLASPVLLGSLLGIAQVGLVNWSFTIVSLPTLPFQRLQVFLFSVFSERKRQDLNDDSAVTSIVYVTALLMGVLGVAVALLMPLLIRYGFGNKWVAAIPIIQVMVLENIFAQPVMMIGTYLMSKGYGKTWFLINVVNVIGRWGLAGIGTLLLGAEGFSMGWVSGTLITFLTGCVAAKRLLGLSIQWYDAVGAALLTIALIKGVTWVTTMQSWSIGLGSVLGLSIGIGLYLTISGLYSRFVRYSLWDTTYKIVMDFR